VRRVRRVRAERVESGERASALTVRVESLLGTGVVGGGGWVGGGL